jgi:hypothetical protein
MRGSIAVAGSLAQRPNVGGHTWVLLQYLLGFQRLGWDVVFIDRLETEMCVDNSGQPCSVERSLNLQYFLEVMERFGLGDSFSLLCDRGKEYLGLTRTKILQRVKNSAFLLNVMGYLTDDAILAAAPRRVFLDIDPGFGQMWLDTQLHDVFAGHDDFVTIGENIGKADCGIPLCGLKWITTPQAVVLDLWPPCRGTDGGRFTTIASWRGAFGPVDYRGATYGLRVHEFRKFVELPRRSGLICEVALDIHPDEVKDLALLRANDWVLVDPRVVAGDPWTYQTYIEGSWAEFMVAKTMYVKTNSGWLSDRSICYLASGRPVLAQDTGLRQLYPVGDGLLTFTSMEEALSGAEELRRRYHYHAQAARDMAEAYFDSDIVLGRLLDALSVA